MDESVYKELGKGRSIFYGWSEAMHTRIDVILCHRPQEQCEAAVRGIVAELKRIEKMISRFDPSSDIARINALAAHQPVAVGPETLEILLSALRFGAKTDCRFDVTHASAKGKLNERLYLDPARRQVLFKVKGVEVDLGGYGKGYALQKVQEKLLADGWTDYLLNFGNSTVCARGDRPGGEGWCIGVENQLRGGSNALELTLRNQSLNTSGNTGQHSNHIYSADRDGYIGGLGSVSVVTDGPLEGEVLSTALFSALDGGRGEDVSFTTRFPGARAYGIDYASGSPVVNVLL